MTKRMWAAILALFLVMPALPQSTISTRNAEHYTWGDCCDGWYLVKNDSLNIIQERMPPGTAEVLHRHAKSRQFFLILRGVATVEHDGHQTVLKEGEGIEIAPGVAHRVKNDSKAALDLVVTSQPPSHGDREDLGPAAPAKK